MTNSFYSRPTLEDLKSIVTAKYYSPFDDSPEARANGASVERECMKIAGSLLDNLKYHSFGIGFSERDFER